MIKNKRLKCMQSTHGALLIILLPFSSGLQLFYGKKQPGKGMEQNPRQQNESEREETKAEVIRYGNVCSRQDRAAYLRLDGHWLLERSTDSVFRLHSRLLC